MPRECSDETRRKQGRGVIDWEHPENYRPWIYARECFHGDGRRHVIRDLKYPERKIHLMSDLELDTYLILRTNPKVLELFEQYPLSMEVTIGICEELGIRHPSNPSTGRWIVMTTDFLAYVKENEKVVTKAYAVKPYEELHNVRTKDKLHVERLYWEKQGIEWAVITERSLGLS